MRRVAPVLLDAMTPGEREQIRRDAEVMDREAIAMCRRVATFRAHRGPLSGCRGPTARARPLASPDDRTIAVPELTRGPREVQVPSGTLVEVPEDRPARPPTKPELRLVRGRVEAGEPRVPVGELGPGTLRPALEVVPGGRQIS